MRLRARRLSAHARNLKNHEHPKRKLECLTARNDHPNVGVSKQFPLARRLIRHSLTLSGLSLNVFFFSIEDTRVFWVAAHSLTAASFWSLQAESILTNRRSWTLTRYGIDEQACTRGREQVPTTQAQEMAARLAVQACAQLSSRSPALV
jgi:hypothetical protein